MEGGHEDGEIVARGFVATVEGGDGVEGDAALGVRASEK